MLQREKILQVVPQKLSLKLEAMQLQQHKSFASHKIMLMQFFWDSLMSSLYVVLTRHNWTLSKPASKLKHDTYISRQI